MLSFKNRLVSTTVLSLVVGVGISLAACTTGDESQQAANPCAAANPCNPCAAANPCNPCAAANPCNPCAAANPCNPCNPCAAGGGAVSEACNVPRLRLSAASNPCAAANPCNPCNPCAAADPCSPCNPCNPCAAGSDIEIFDMEAIAVYNCLLAEMKTAYAKSDNPIAISYTEWPRFSIRAYQSATHGGRFVQNYANKEAKSYAKWEKAGVMPAGAQLVKDSFTLKHDGSVSVGPLFLMEKMAAGFNPDSDDWQYTLIMPNGSTVGTTNGAGSANVEFCIECHKGLSEVDSMLFVPEELRGG